MGQGVAYYVLARVAEGRGELAEAEAHGRRACELLVMMPAFHLLASTTLSATLLARGQVSEARAVSEQGVRELEGQGDSFIFNTVAVRWALAEACFAQGDTVAGEEALRQALRDVHARAADIEDAAARQRFLEQVPENARVLALARQHRLTGEVG
jgi:hypothetical protein